MEKPVRHGAQAYFCLTLIDHKNIIMRDLVRVMQPKYIEVKKKSLPRGGISIDPYANYGMPGTKYEVLAWECLSMHDRVPERVDNR